MMIGPHINLINLLMGVFMKVNGLNKNVKDVGNNYGLMENIMKVNGLKIVLMESD